VSLGSGDGTSKLSGGIDPELDSLIRALERSLLRISMSQTSQQLWYFSDIALILSAPIENDLVLVHDFTTGSPGEQSPFRGLQRPGDCPLGRLGLFL
jgi:hypothetical protein